MEFYHEKIVNQVNALKTRSYYIPFTDENFSPDKEKSKEVVVQKMEIRLFPRVYGGSFRRKSYGNVFRSVQLAVKGVRLQSVYEFLLSHSFRSAES